MNKIKEKINIKALFIYILLSYVVAIITIILIYFNNSDNLSKSQFMDCINILFSTNACFIITTGWGMRTSLFNIHDNTFKAYNYIGVLICGTFNATSLFETKLPVNLYVVMLLITLFICFNIAKDYIKNGEEVDGIIAKHNEEATLIKAQEIISQSNDLDKFDMDNSEFKI